MSRCACPAVCREEFGDLVPQWGALLDRSAQDTLFLDPRWQWLWWRELAGDAQPLLVSLREEGTLVGLAPLMRRGGVLSFIGGPDLFDYHDFVVARGWEETFLQCLVDFLAGEEWDLVDLRSIPEGSPTLGLLPALARRRGLECTAEAEGVAPGLPLPSSWEEYLRLLTRKDRHELRRKLRRLYSSARVRLVCLSTPQEVAPAVDDFLRLMRASSPEKDLFLTPERERFFRRLAVESAGWGLLRLFLLEVDGERAAGVLCFDYKGSRLLYNSGFDPRFSWLSVGLLAKALCLQDAVEKGLSYFDFLRGDEDYKYDLGARDRRLYTLTLRR